MKITKSWRSGGYLSVKFLGGLLGLGMVFGFLVPMVRAEGSEVTVVPGAGNLKTAVESAEDGTTIKLQRGSYSGSVNDRTINIDHSITIEGAGGMSRQSIVDVPFKITKPGVTVTLKGFSTSMTQVEDNFTYIQVAAENVTLNLEDLNYDGILRGMGNGRYPDLRSHVLDITESADHANVTIKDSSFYKTGTKYAVWNKASNATVTLDNSTLGSRTPKINYILIIIR